MVRHPFDSFDGEKIEMTQTTQDEVQRRLAERPPSVGAMLQQQVETSGGREAFRYRDGERWVSLTWADTRDRAFELAAGLLDLGVALEDRVAIASGTRIEWILADLAVMCAGGATTTVYPTTQHEDVAYILGDSEARVVFAEDDLQVAKVLDHLHELPNLTAVVQIAGRVDHELVISWADLWNAAASTWPSTPGRWRPRSRRPVRRPWPR